MTPAPLISHQKISGKLYRLQAGFVEKMNSGDVLIAPCDVVLSKLNIVQPDILFISNENRHIMKEKNIQGAPDLVVEITSPSTRFRDLKLKKQLYAQYGVKEYWIVYSKEEKIEVWFLENNRYLLTGSFAEGDEARSVLLPEFRVETVRIFKK